MNSRLGIGNIISVCAAGLVISMVYSGLKYSIEQRRVKAEWEKMVGTNGPVRKEVLLMDFDKNNRPKRVEAHYYKMGSTNMIYGTYYALPSVLGNRLAKEVFDRE